MVRSESCRPGDVRGQIRTGLRRTQYGEYRDAFGVDWQVLVLGLVSQSFGADLGGCSFNIHRHHCCGLELLVTRRPQVRGAARVKAVNLDQKQPGFPEHVLPDYLRSVGVPFHIENEDTYSIVKRLIPEGKTTCSLCSRLRRGILYRVADELGATKIALGHHRDDILATLLLNMFFGGKLKSMPPKLVSDDGRHVVIRPLAFVAEKDTTQWAKVRQFPIIPCNLCGSQENLQRKQVGEMLREWQKKYPGRVENMANALQNVVPSHLLDGALYDFKGAHATGVADDNGDKAFDAEDFPEPSALPGVQVVRIQ